MTIPTSAWPEITAVIAAVIAGAASFIVTVLSKEQKTSEFRQAWIDGLRNDIAQYLAAAGAFNQSVILKTRLGRNAADFEKFHDSQQETIRRMLTCYYRIHLRLNSHEHALLLERLDYFREYLTNHGSEANTNQIAEVTSLLINEAEKVMKAEWKRVKRGELIYRVTKYGSLGMLVLAVVCAAYLAAGYVASGVVGLLAGAMLGWFSKCADLKAKPPLSERAVALFRRAWIMIRSCCRTRRR